MKSYGKTVARLGLILGALLVSGAKPMPLNWRAVELPALNWNREAIQGGAALFTIPGGGERKFRLEFHFASGLYAFPPERMVELEAFADMLILGGAGARSYEELGNHLQENGIEAATALGSRGELTLSLSGLSEDLPTAIRVAGEILLQPRFDARAVELWKQEKLDSFQSLIDGGSQAKQRRFISYELNKMAFGPTHVLTRTLARMAPTAINTVTTANLPALAKSLVNRAGLNTYLAGGYSQRDSNAVRALLASIPRREVLANLWLPERPPQPTTPKLRFAVVSKPDLKQSLIEIRVVSAKAGELNQLEKTHLRVAGEILSASGGVVGTDRWSKAMRADSGLSYSASASFTENTLIPNTNIGIWRLFFQSPNNRIHEACLLAKKTWDDFVLKGVTADEVDGARTSEMNGILALENTIFDKADSLIQMVEEGRFPSSVGQELWLARLEQSRDAGAINRSLERVARQDTIPVMVIFGNPNDEQIKRLKSENGFEFVESLPFADLVREIR
jgi:hypothetical protein